MWKYNRPWWYIIRLRRLASSLSPWVGSRSHKAHIYLLCPLTLRGEAEKAVSKGIWYSSARSILHFSVSISVSWTSVHGHAPVSLESNCTYADGLLPALGEDGCLVKVWTSVSAFVYHKCAPLMCWVTFLSTSRTGCRKNAVGSHSQGFLLLRTHVVCDPALKCACVERTERNLWFSQLHFATFFCVCVLVNAVCKARGKCGKKIWENICVVVISWMLYKTTCTSYRSTLWKPHYLVQAIIPAYLAPCVLHKSWYVYTWRL